MNGRLRDKVEDRLAEEAEQERQDNKRDRSKSEILGGKHTCTNTHVNGVVVVVKGEAAVILHTHIHTCHHQQQSSRCKRATVSLARPALEEWCEEYGVCMSILSAGMHGILNIASTNDDICMREVLSSRERKACNHRHTQRR